MADDLKLTDDERAAILEAREKNKTPRKVTIRAKDETSGAEYSFDLEGEEAETVIERHKGLFTRPATDPKDVKPPRPTLIPRAKSG